MCAIFREGAASLLSLLSNSPSDRTNERTSITDRPPTQPNSLREAGRPLPLVLRPVLTPEEKEAKQQLRKNLEYGNLVFAAIFLYNLATTAVNNEHPWNYSGNNDAICAQMAANGEESKMCTSWNADYIKAPKTERPAGVDLSNTQKATPKTSGDALGFLFGK